MKKQNTLFDGVPEARANTQVKLGVPGSAPTLSKAQKQFNKWIAKIGSQRGELARWQEFMPRYAQWVAGEFEPLNARKRLCQVEMVRLLDRAMQGSQLGKTQRAKVTGLVLNLLAGLLADEEDEELIALHDKYSGASFKQAQAEELDYMRELAGTAFGMEFDDDAPAASHEELARQIKEKMDAAGQAEPARRAKKAGKKSARQSAREAREEKAREHVTQSVREIYRKLVSELHPDREADPAERERKTALMQKVNQAYAKQDLLALLELQLQIEQIDPAALAGMAEERLLRYNAVLQEQSMRLEEEIAHFVTPFLTMAQGAMPRSNTPETVQRAIDADARALAAGLAQMEADVAACADIKHLKKWLRGVRLARAEPEEFDMLDALFVATTRSRR